MSLDAKIHQLRKLLTSHRLNGFLIPSKDEFQNEYTPEESNRLKFITGFSGSNGVALITHKQTILFTDGRYLLQAEQELSKEFLILNITQLYDNQYLSGNIGYDPKLHTAKNLSLYKNVNLLACDNLVDKIWIEKPTITTKKTFEYPIKQAGETSSDKINKISNYLQINQIDSLIITDPANICWLLNQRGNDIEYNPIFLAYAILSQNGKLDLFMNNDRDLSLFSNHLQSLANKNVQIDSNSASIWISNHIINPIFKEDPCLLAKACKNKTEIQQARRIHAIDGVALCKLLHWIENNQTTEIGVAEKLLEFRSLNKDFLYPSFATIAGFSEHGAIIHYHATETSNKKIEGNALFLLDSGGQYFGATTDITRVIPIGKTTYQQKLDFTLVLKGHIALAMAKFPQGTSGANLDILARQFLWQYNKDYAHGTGHGVGNCLSVHEGPQSISKINTHPLMAGMIISNEPGYYKTGEYGIRIENLMLIKELKNGYLGMEILSLAPIDQRLISKKLLTLTEIEWLNSYHQKVYQKLSPHLNKEEKAWLKNSCRLIAR